MLIRTLAIALFISACSSVPSPSTAPEAAPTAPVAEDLIGTWDVALYFSPDSPPSATVMEISAVNTNGTLTGTFYQSAFETGRYTTRDGEVIISVVTSDGSAPYATSGRLSTDGAIEGQTLSLGRDFLMAWSATKAEE